MQVMGHLVKNELQVLRDGRVFSGFTVVSLDFDFVAVEVINVNVVLPLSGLQLDPLVIIIHIFLDPLHVVLSNAVHLVLDVLLCVVHVRDESQLDSVLHLFLKLH